VLERSGVPTRHVVEEQPMATSYAISESTGGPAVRVDLAGEIDLAAITEIRTRVHALLARDDVHAVLIDLAAATFIDSSGIGVLVACRHAATAAAKRLRVVGAVGRVARVLGVTGVTAFLADDE